MMLTCHFRNRRRAIQRSETGDASESGSLQQLDATVTSHAEAALERKALN